MVFGLLIGLGVGYCGLVFGVISGLVSVFGCFAGGWCWCWGLVFWCFVLLVLSQVWVVVLAGLLLCELVLGLAVLAGILLWGGLP